MLRMQETRLGEECLAIAVFGVFSRRAKQGRAYLSLRFVSLSDFCSFCIMGVVSNCLAHGPGMIKMKESSYLLRKGQVQKRQFLNSQETF